MSTPRLLRLRGALGSIAGSRRGEIGGAPGTLPSAPEAPRPRIRVIGFGPEALEEIEVEDVAELAGLRQRFRVIWVNVDGIGHGDSIAAIGNTFGLHPLALEDVVNTPQRAKSEEYDDNLFVVAFMAHLGEDRTAFNIEQLSLFIGGDFVVTFQEREGDCFEPIRDRLRRGRARIRSSGSDYLGYALLDAVVDSIFPVLERLDERLVELEDDALTSVDHSVALRIKEIKRQVRYLFRTVFPVRDALLRLLRDESGLIDQDAKLFLRDVYDHAAQAIDLLQDAREFASDLTDLHRATLGDRLNDIMKFLTIFSTIFIPLGFIAGLYGMNFDAGVSRWNMPELSLAYGYPMALALMLMVAVGLLAFFRHKGWLGGGDE